MVPRHCCAAGAGREAQSKECAMPWVEEVPLQGLLCSLVLVMFSVINVIQNSGSVEDLGFGSSVG